MNARVLALTSLFVLAACGGGGGAANAPLSDLPPNSPQLGPQSSASLTLTVPRGPSSSKRSPDYVSPNSASIEITVLTVNGSAPTATQVPVNPTTAALSTASGGNCTVSGAGETCTVQIPAPTGAVQYRFRLKDAGAVHVLAQNTVTLTIAAGVANQSFSVQLDGVVASVTTTLPVLTPGTSFSGPITVQAFDASGAMIVGSAPYANPFTLTDNDKTGHTSLTLNSQTALTVGPVMTPNDVVILNYDGGPDVPFTVTATITPAP